MENIFGKSSTEGGYQTYRQDYGAWNFSLECPFNGKEMWSHIDVTFVTPKYVNSPNERQKMLELSLGYLHPLTTCGEKFTLFWHNQRYVDYVKVDI